MVMLKKPINLYNPSAIKIIGDKKLNFSAFLTICVFVNKMLNVIIKTCITVIISEISNGLKPMIESDAEATAPSSPTANPETIDWAKIPFSLFFSFLFDSKP